MDDVVSSLYDRIGAPALTNAQIKITIDGKEGRASQLYPSDMYDLFSGDQLVIVGKYRKAGAINIKLTGEFLGEKQEFVFDDELPKQTGSGKNVFVERLWATRRIGEIIDDIDLHGEQQELVEELIVLSKRHGILTPYTAYLAEERTDLNDIRRGRQITSDRLRALNEEAGRSAFFQRSLKGNLKAANKAQPLADSLEMSIRPQIASGAIPTRSSTPSGIGGRRSNGFGVAGGADSSSVARPTPADGLANDDSTEAPGKELKKRDAPIKQIANKTFFLRENRYVDADATKEQIDKATKVERFSDDYFDLLKEHGDDIKSYLADEADLLVVLKGKSYWIYTKVEKE